MYEKIPLAGVDTEGWLRLRKSGIGGSVPIDRKSVV